MYDEYPNNKRWKCVNSFSYKYTHTLPNIHAQKYAQKYALGGVEGSGMSAGRLGAGVTETGGDGCGGSDVGVGPGSDGVTEEN